MPVDCQGFKYFIAAAYCLLAAMQLLH